jgi:hypothetical protein
VLTKPFVPQTLVEVAHRLAATRLNP